MQYTRAAVNSPRAATPNLLAKKTLSNYHCAYGEWMKALPGSAEAYVLRVKVSLGYSVIGPKAGF